MKIKVAPVQIEVFGTEPRSVDTVKHSQRQCYFVAVLAKGR